MRTLRPPRGGTAPPATAAIGGATLFLAPLAHAVWERYSAEYPDEIERYGPAVRDWCIHDTQWLLAWASHDAAGREGILAAQLKWLAGVLAARGYPLERLARTLVLAAEAVEEAHGDAGAAVGDALRAGEKLVRSLSGGAVRPRR